MNVAYLDPAYSRYFHELAGCLASRTGGQSVALLSSPAYRQYTCGDRAVVWPPGQSKQLRHLPPEFEHATWAPLNDPRSVAVFSQAVAWFIERFIDESTDVCLVFSDARPFSVAARLAAQELGIVCLYFERGAFRLCSSSLSTQGLNARFSLKRAQAQARITGLAADQPLPRRPIEPWLRTRFARFVLHNALACLLDRDRGRIQHKRYSLRRYLRLALSQLWAEHHPWRSKPGEMDDLAGRPLIVVPLQLPTDSQLVLHSPFPSNQHFIDFVVQQARQVAPEALLVFKRHPMDASRYRLPAGARWVDGNLARFDPLQPVIVCINSTVGFESLVRGVRVLCFAPSFYADAPALALVTPDTFAAALAQRLQAHGDPDAGQALRAAVLRWYQAPGDAWAFTREDIEQTSEIVLQHYRAARLVLASTQRVLPWTLRAVGAGDPASA